MSAKGSELKRVRQAKKANLKNKGYKSAIKTLMKKSQSTSDKSDDFEVNIKAAVSIIDKASNKKIIHKNKAARYKSKLMKNR